MKKIKSFTGIWNVEKVLYGISDIQLPFPVTFTQMSWFVMSLLTVIVFGDIPPLSMIPGVLMKYMLLPVGITVFMSKKTFDGKKPYRFVQTVFAYWFRPKLTFAGNAVKLKKQVICPRITAVRSKIYDISD